MPRHLLPFVFSAFAAFCCGAQTPKYKAAQYSGYINRFYTLCFDPENMLWAGGPSNGLPHGLPNGVILHRMDANLNTKAGRHFSAEPDIEYPVEIGWDAGDRIIGCGNYQDGGFGTGFVFRFRPQTTPSQLLFIKKIEGGEVRLSGLIENTADTSLIVYGTSLAGGVQRGELFKLHRNTGTLRPAFPKRYTAAGQGLSFDAAILQEGRLYTAGASWLGGVLDGNSVTCINAATGEPLWLNSTHIVGTHLKARDLVFTDEDNFDGGSLFVVSNSDNPQNPAQGSHIFLQKINLDGSLQWTQKIDLPDWTDEYAEEILTVSGGFLIYGRSRNPAQQGVFLLKTDYSGKPMWAKRILRGSETWLPDWPAQAQMLVRNEAIYLTCNAVVTTGVVLSPPNVGLIFKLQLDGTLANCSTVQPTPAVNLPVGNQGNVNFLLNEEASPLQVNTVAASVLGSGGTYSPGTICQQTGYLCNDLPDLTVRVDSTYCSPATGGLGASVRFCNVGKVFSPPVTYLSFYDSNPLTGPAKRVFTRFLVGTVDSNACKTLQIELTPAFQNNRRYYVLLGADSTVQTPIMLGNLPLSGGFAECAYTNNLDSFDLALPLDCFPTDCDPITFLRPLAGNQDNQSFSCITASGDGNLYLAGTRKGRTILAKMAPDSKILWARSFTVAPFNDVTLAEIIVDSEGMMVGSGRQGTNNSTRGIAFRYDPNADQMLWIQLFDSDRASGGGILEKNPGGNYLLNQVPRLPEFLVFNGEILELDRATGQIVPGFAKRYQHGYAEGFSKIIAHGGALYATGFVDSVVNNELARRMILTKLDPNTGAVIWSRMGHMEWERPAYFSGSNLLVDDEGNLLTMYFGSEETYRINLGDGYKTYNFLQKTTLDGEILWVKRYDFNSARALATLPDGYLVTTGTYLIKLDKNGNILKARRVTDPGSAFANISQNQNAVRRLGDHLFSIYVQALKSNLNVNHQRTLLLKTDLDLELAYACNGYVPATERDSFPAVQPAQYAAEQTLRPSPAVQQTPVPVFAPDTVFVQKALCPDCPDSLCADVRVRMDSLSCSPAGGIVANLSVCNLGGAPVDSGFYLTFYDKNPLVGGAAVLQSVFLQEKPAPGACMQLQLPWDAALLQQPQVFTLVGADGNVPTPISLSSFPFSNGYAECDYANNLDSFLVKKPDCAPDSCHPSTFWKIFGRQGNWINISALRAAPDGNLYMAGRQDDHLTIGKMAPDGQFLWTRSLTLTPLQRPLIAEIIVDSEGMIVGSGNLTAPNTGENKGVFAFRYDPATNQVLWVRSFNAFRSTEGGILEKTPGGNFLLHYNVTTLPGQIGAEILELDRTTGQIVPAFAKRYEYQYSQAFSNIVAHGGAIYATGYTIRKVGNSGFRRMVMAKLDASTGGMIWSRTGLTDWPQASDFAGGDLIVDDNSLITMYYGSETSNSAFGNLIKLYLQKTTLDGEVLWVKRYDLPAAPRELLAVSDGYIIFAGASERFILKTDKEGNLLTSKKLDSQTFFFAGFTDDERNQVERIGQYLYFAHNTARSNQSYGYTTLLKTDLNLEMDFDCDLDPYPVQASSVAFQPNIMAQQVVTESVPTQQTLSTTLGSDFVILHKSCPTCATQACTNLPDITAHVDSITCSLPQGAVAHISICNLGQVMPSAGLHLTFYSKNPLAVNAVRLQSVFLQEKPSPGQCLQTVLPLNAALLQSSKVYTLAGVDGNVQQVIDLGVFPFANGYAECNYANNLDSFATALPPIQKLELGPDRIICEGQTVTLDAGSGYASYNWLNGDTTQTLSVSTTGTYIAEVTDACGRVQRDTSQVTVSPKFEATRTITFYPGDTIVIGGTAYTQPDTVVQNFTTSAGCDSVVTNILQLVITQLEVKCPADLTVTLPPNETTTVVDYPLPTATTNCPDQTIALRLLQGLPVGGSFPQGKTLVCYEAANQCGIRDTCCFTVTAVIPEQPCDVKTPPGCVRYELLSIQLDALGQRRYRVRMTNTCASPLEFAYLQLPNGVLAVAPAQNTTYTAPGGNAYAVRNPNASPFYSVRYKAVVENLNNGKSDIFEYTLPQQSAPAYIRAASRLADGTYSEAHLNTFFCPVLPHQGAENRSADFPGSLLPGHLSVWPNPTDGTLFVNLNGWRGQTIRLQVLNAQGQTVLSQQVWAENGRLELALPANMVNGLYYLRAVEMVSGQRPSPAAAVRFVVER